MINQPKSSIWKHQDVSTPTARVGAESEKPRCRFAAFLVTEPQLKGSTDFTGIASYGEIGMYTKRRKPQTY